MNQSSPDQHDAGFVRLAWHPAVEWLLWIITWLIFSAAAAINWEYLATWRLDGPAIVARTIWIAVAIFCLLFVVFLVDLLGGLAQETWDRYRGVENETLRRISYTVLLGLFLFIAIPYLWFVGWVLEQISPAIGNFVESLGAIPFEPVSHGIPYSGTAILSTWLVSIVVSGWLAWRTLVRFRGNPFYPYQGSSRVLGWKKLLLGIAMMIYLRSLGPRRDLRIQWPVFSYALFGAMIIVLHEIIPVTVFSWLIPLLIVVNSVPYLVSTIAPPIWLFLGTSGYQSAQTFSNLRNKWQYHGVNLLDRDHPGAVHFYHHWRSGLGPRIFFDPSIPRIWSIRTRPRVWQTAFRFLSAYVQWVIVDQRDESEIVDFEMAWLNSRNYQNKVLVLGDTAKSNGARVVDEAYLLGMQIETDGNSAANPSP